MAVINGVNMSTHHSFTTQLSEVIRSHRKMSGLTQNQLANFSGVGKTVIFDLEHGKETVRLNTLLKVLSVLNIELKIVSPLGEVNAQSKSL